MKVKLLKRASFLRRVFDNTNAGQKLYIFGLVWMLFALPVWFVSEKYSTYYLLLGISAFSIGLVVEGIIFFSKLWDYKFGKIIISAIFSVVTTFTIASSSATVAEIVGTDPSKFPYAITLTSFLLFPIFTWVILQFSALTFFVFHTMLVPLYWLYHQFRAMPLVRYSLRLKVKPPKERFMWLLVFTRAIAVGFLISNTQVLGKFNKDYLTGVENNISWFIYNFELYKKSHCTKQNEQEKFGYINAKLAVVGTLTTDKKHLFSTRTCIEIPSE